MKVLVTYSEYCLHDEHDGEQYGSWSKAFDFSIDSVEVIDESDKNRSYSSDAFLTEDGDTVYVMWMRYGSGDSFGSSSGQGVILGCWTNHDKVTVAFDKVKASLDDYSITVLDDFDREIKIHNPAAGYFESCESLEVDEFAVGTGSKKLSYKP